MKLFWDTNVMLDFLGEREPFYISSAKIATLADKREITVIVSALSYATIDHGNVKILTIRLVVTYLRQYSVGRVWRV